MSSTSSFGNTPRVESLFEAERIIVPEPDEVRRRVLRRAQAAVAHGLPVRGTTVGSGSRGVFFGKVAAAIVLLVGLTAVGYELGYRRSRVVPKVVAPSVAPSPAVMPEPVPVPAEVAAVIDSLSEPLPALPRHPTKHRSLSAAIGGDPYAMELRLLRPAQLALGRSSFANALALVVEHQRRFPSGHFAEEREALRVKALVGLDRREEARKAAAAFQVRFPNSALLARIQAMLGTEP